MGAVTMRDGPRLSAETSRGDARYEDRRSGSSPSPPCEVTASHGRRTDGRVNAITTDVRTGPVPPEVALSVSGLSKRFGDGDDAITAVDDISVEIEAGSIVGLLGPNGAGKTTLIKSILGMVLPDEGTVRIRGIDVYEQPRKAYAHVDAMLEGARNDYWRLTVRENLRYFATISGVDPNSVADRHDRLLAQLELTDWADVPVRELSRGMKQKVSLASVLAGGARVVFLDEPTLGLDIESSRTLQRELRRLAEEEGLTVVLSSHNMDVVETVCDRVLIVVDGRIVADDSVDALLSSTDHHVIEIASRDLDATLISTLRGQVGLDVTAVERLEVGARITVSTDSDGLYELMDRLRAANVALERVRTIEPDLEDVFVGLTTKTEETR
jgi:ABC-2 type transport system ATP-binding protein